jgi:hypothetical protein
VEARGLKTCLGFKGDSTAASTEYIAAINASASQLCPMHPMSVADVYALVTSISRFCRAPSLQGFRPAGHQDGDGVEGRFIQSKSDE